MFAHHFEGRERLPSLAIVLALHAALLWAVLQGAGVVPGAASSPALRIFDVAPPAPPPPQPEAPPARREAAPREEGAAAPSSPGRAEQPTPAERADDVPPWVAAGIVPAEPGAAFAGAGDRPDEGSGAGGQGSGSGSGAGGSGSGGGGGAVTRPQLRAGRIVPADYPRGANGEQGAVTAELEVGADGRVTGCAVVRSSGNRVLDDTTCRLIRERFRFAPARDQEGRAVATTMGWRQTWWREREGRAEARR